MSIAGPVAADAGPDKLASGDVMPPEAHHSDFEDDDVAALTAILESEMRIHRKKRAICLAMFCISLVSLIIGLVLGSWQIATELLPGQAGLQLSDGLQALQLLAPIAAFAMWFFTAWWACENCINSIERTLFAARARRRRLFKQFVEQISCADKKKKRVWLEVVGAFVT
jgi:hypothetical protein